MITQGCTILGVQFAFFRIINALTNVIPISAPSLALPVLLVASCSLGTVLESINPDCFVQRVESQLVPQVLGRSHHTFILTVIIALLWEGSAGFSA